MPITNNFIRGKGLPVLLMTALMTTGLFSCRNVAYADRVILSEETYYHLDMGVQLAYNAGCGWGSGNLYGRLVPLPVNTTITFNSDVEVLDTYPLNSAKGSSFDFRGEKSSHNIPRGLGAGDSAYDIYYANYVSTSMTEGNCISSGKNVSFQYTAVLNTPSPLEVVEFGEDERGSEIYRLFGGKSALERDQPEIAEAVEAALTAGREGTAGTNKLYLIFCPNVIEYKKYITVGDLKANLSLPASAKQGEIYMAKDHSYIDNSLTVASAVLEKHCGDGAWEKVAVWDGPGIPGENSGGSVEESWDEICTITYRLIVTATSGQVDSDVKTIRIVDNREISVTADLVLPSHTYEGHPALASDESTFIVDGTYYSSERAYAEKIASNSFKANTSYGTVTRLNNTKADVTFSKRGTYTVTLTVKPTAGSTVQDTEPIEVRKTPYILDHLTGFQKQNRKQILNIAVATYPGKPITDYAITLKDKVTGDLVRLTPGNTQENNLTIKTRTIQRAESDDGCYTYLTLEFLTKTPAYNPADPDYDQDFYYEIRVEDSKGDTDTATKTFTVKPDLPPAAAIGLDTAFLRNEGTNTAAIRAEDVTVAADGDEVERTWFYGATTAPAVFTNVTVMDGYKRLSFGTDKIVGFNKVGVGTFTTKLFVKEKWTEPTLEEYVTDADRLTGTAIACSDVQNVAPVVSLELLSGTEQEILLLADNNAEYQALTNRKTALQQTLLANQIAGQIIIKKLVGSTPANVADAAQQRTVSYPYPARLNGTLATEVDESRLLAVDSEYTYFLTYTWVNGNPTVPKTIHAISPYSGEAWSHTTNRDEAFDFGQDDTGKYLYLIYRDSNQTVLLDKRTGATAGTINIALSERVWLSDNLIFMTEGGSLYAVELNTLTKMLVSTDISAVSRAGGKLQYVACTKHALIRCAMDMETLSVDRDILIQAGSNTANARDYKAVCIDSTGKAVLWKDSGLGADQFNGIKVFDANSKLIKEIPITRRYSDGGSYQLFHSLDEEGKCNHVFYWERRTQSSPDQNSLNGIDLNTGTVKELIKNTDAYANIWSSFGGAFESKGTSHFMFNGWYLYPGGTYYYGNNYTFTFTGTSAGMGVLGPAAIGSLDENIKVSDRIIAALHGDNNPANGKFTLKILAFPRTLAQETAEIISRFTSKRTFVGNVNTTAADIIENAEAPKSTVRITAAQNGFLTLANQSLAANQKYYYEYEIKPLTEAAAASLTGMTAATGTATSNQSFLSDTFFVEKTYEEDFNDSEMNRFFTVSDPGIYNNGYWGCYYTGSGSGDTYSALTFTVPNGKQAILSFDWMIYYRGKSGHRNSVYIDGEKMYEDLPEAQINTFGHCVFQNILGPGSHTLECSTPYNSAPYYTMIDNLKAEIISTTAPVPAAAVNQREGDEKGWLIVDGTFETPNQNISYGAQASTCWTGTLPGEYTRYYQQSKYGTAHPYEVRYTSTLPAGYLARGYAYPYVDRQESSTVTLWNNTYSMYSGSTALAQAAAISNGYKLLLGNMTPGTYTYTLRGPMDTYVNPRITPVQIITFPNNAVTATGNMVFNSTCTKYYFPKAISTGKTNLSINLPKGEYLIKSIRIYSIENGQKIYLQNKNLAEPEDLLPWSLSAGLTATVDFPEKEKNDDEYIKIYKKGEKILYNIFYSDYEKDPSKIGYWTYQHVNWPPDGVHPDVGKVLNASIDRIYLSGKYTVTHWEADNTQRPGTHGDASGYDKESNKVDLVFYVDGGGKAPWVTYIKTNPAAVKENSTYTLSVGVDDTEKDTLTLETEVYCNGKSILTHRRENLQANAYGDYPETRISGLPQAQPAVYQVICTVSDYSGTGIRSYKFTVVSDGRVTGMVNHTEKWDENRKKYNLKRFGEEVNREMLLGDYTAMSLPRKRGTNVFWSGEKFMLRAETEGNPNCVQVQIFSRDAQGGLKNTGYSSELADTGKKTPGGAQLWEGSVWDPGMINKWGRHAPEELTFRFTAFYPEALTKTHTVTVIVDSERDYWQLHRLW